MYEPFFGLRARPFASAPDPDFYFESRGHHRALAYLRHGITEGDSFMVMTGEIGAGKTTLIHKLLRELDAHGIEAALLVSSQLDANELLGAAASAFGASAAATPAEDLQVRLRTTLSALAGRGRRALLVIDEAQNLQPDAIELLADFASQQAEGTLDLQVLLVGQPELSELIQRRTAPAHRQPVFLYCHIGLLSEQETRDYIEHRLRLVGWIDSPSFATEAYPRIHALTQGVPRRINRLCDRLLLAAYLRAQKTISARLVEQVDAELRGELHEGVLPAQQGPGRSASSTMPAVGVPTRPRPQPGAAIPTLSALVTPQPDTEAGRSPLPPDAHAEANVTPSAAPAQRAPAARSPPPAFLFPTPGGPASAEPPGAVSTSRHRIAIGAGGVAALLIALLAGWYASHRKPQESPREAAPAAAQAPAPVTAPAPAPVLAGPAAAPAPAPAVPPALPRTGERAPPPVAAPCTAAVIALGLCTSPTSPPTSQE